MLQNERGQENLVSALCSVIPSWLMMRVTRLATYGYLLAFRRIIQVGMTILIVHGAAIKNNPLGKLVLQQWQYMSFSQTLCVCIYAAYSENFINPLMHKVAKMVM